MKRLITWGIVGSAAIIIGGIASYIWKFYNHAWSNDPAVWGQLGDYLNMYVSAASLALVSVLTYIIHQADVRRAEEESAATTARESAKNADERARNRPVLVFMVYKNELFQPFWKVKNISNNVALNPLISFSITPNNWQKPVVIYSLGPGQEVKLPWAKPALQICAVYYDINDNVLTSMMQNDRVEIKPETNLLSHFPVDQYTRWEDIAY